MTRALQFFFIVLSLLVAQQTAFAHELSHLAREPASSPTQQHPHKACLECGLLAQLGTAFASHIATSPAAGNYACNASQPSRVYYPGIPRRFLSRAPPVFR
jgi:hypothetical protein